MYLRNLTFSICALFCLTLAGQQFHSYEKHIHPADSVLFTQCEVLTLPEAYKKPGQKELPDYLNNSLSPYFRPIFNQFGWSCGQASTIGYNFTYEMNRAHNTMADVPENQFPTAFQYNFFNGAENGVGVCYLYTFEGLKKCGTPSVADYGSMGESLSLWPDGYDIYLQAMSNRAGQMYSIPVGTEEGLQTLKHWFYDHLDGSETGGLANFYTDLQGFTYLPAGTPEEGKAVITAFGAYTGHSMTFVGWNDSIRWDYNNDGQYTNDLDINEDGFVNMKDWEIGGVILANSWGSGWADDGFSYVMYNVLAMEKAEGGIWNKQVNVMDVKADYQPTLAYKITLQHNSRNKIKVMAGVSTDTTSTWPDHLMEFPIFNFQGGDFYMQGINDSSIYKTITFGLDVTPLISYIGSDQSARFFCLIIENDPDNQATGIFHNFSLMDYSNGSLEVDCQQTDEPLVENGTTILAVNHSLSFDPVKISTEELPAYDTTQTYSVQLAANGGTEPYRWSLAQEYLQTEFPQAYEPIEGTILTASNYESGYATQALDFEFPFYDKFYDSITAHVDGFLMFRPMPYPLPYQVNDLMLLKQEKMIAPFLNKNIFLSSVNDNHIYYEGDETHATFRWVASLSNGLFDYPVDFSTTLYPDGRIAFEMDQTTFPVQEVSRVSGISAGDETAWQCTQNSYIPPNKNQSWAAQFVPQNYPSVASVTSGGLLNFSANDNHKIYALNLRATDDKDISDTKQFLLSSGLTYTYQLHDDNNNVAEFGDTLLMDMLIKNSGTSSLSGLSMKLSYNDPYVNLGDSLIFIGNINGGQSLTIPDAYSLIIDPAVPDEYRLGGTLHFESSENFWEGRLDIDLVAPNLQFNSASVDDENHRPDPGETVFLKLSVSNQGHATAKSVIGILQTTDPYIAINNPGGELNIGDIVPGSTVIDSISISIADDCPQGHITNFQIGLSPQTAPEFTENFTLLIGRYPVLLVDLDPQSLSSPVCNDILEELNVLHDYADVIPLDMDEYQNIFVFLGRKFSSHELSETEGDLLAGYLNNGGHLYMEGSQTWYDDPQTAMHSYFHVSPEFFGWEYFDSIAGSPGSFADSTQMDYEGLLAYFNYEFVPGENAFPILYNTNPNHVIAVAHEEVEYKTIASIFDFGALIDGEPPSTKKELLTSILDFFDVEIIATSTDDRQDRAGEIRCIPNPVNDHATLIFHAERGGMAQFTLYSYNGEMIGQPRKINSGMNTFPIQLDQLPAGIYFGKLSIDNENHLIKIVKL